ncbi:acetyltransferase (GNAT) family protein [Silicimonas algicola]|uniref:Acetyltransferase (GNAT) family protein n=2 Tax=Silicimonas algicola TaxID=1826607 RepID=A0A316GLI9_9RHOB|nr:GNAT family N-acetyltransferase [Silicimonas algicola]PWK55707.1 acetyltransferase (GNAT) family protein [Silicimonas algicola]
MERVSKVRTSDEIDTARALVWEFFDSMKERYPDMIDTIDDYFAKQDVAGELADFAARFLPPRGEAFLAWHEGEAVGLVLLKRHGEGDGEMNRMFVRASARGQGLGRALGEALVAEARARGMGTVWLDALYRHVEALPLYESLGFVRYTNTDAFHGSDARVIHMKLVL